MSPYSQNYTLTAFALGFHLTSVEILLRRSQARSFATVRRPPFTITLSTITRELVVGTSMLVVRLRDTVSLPPADRIVSGRSLGTKRTLS